MPAVIRYFVPLCLATALLAGCKKDKTDDDMSAAASPKPSYYKEDLQTTTATVEAVDKTTREVTIKNEDGELATFRAGPEVQNFDQLEKGDRVEAQYYEALAIDVHPAGGASKVRNETEQAVARTAELGEKRAGVGARQVTLKAKVEKIDRSKQRVTVKGEAGRRSIYVRNPKNLENIKVGDEVVATYTEALAVAVKKVP